MNRQSIQKLQLFLGGMEQRILENREYFKKITVRYKAGVKEFAAQAVLWDSGNGEHNCDDHGEGCGESNEDIRLNFHFLGRSESLEVFRLAARISSYAETYESVHVLYEERGTNIVIEGDNKNVKMHYTDPVKEEPVRQQTETSHIGNREYLIKVGSADDVLREIGILSREGKIKNDMIRKYNQIDHFVELIDDMLKELTQEGSITVLDCGCGKSYLTFVLNYYIKEVLKKPCYFIGLDYSEGVIEASKKIAKNLGYSNMEFHKTDIRDYQAGRDIHLVISLHACDTATDDALALGIRNRAKAMVSVPCCHREILSQYSIAALAPVLKHGVFKARMADILTDGLRSLFLESQGYKVSVVEYISPLETPKNLMIRAVKETGANSRAREEYLVLKKLLNVEPSLEKLVFEME